MKKLIVLVALALFVAAPSFAATLVTNADGSATTVDIGGGTFKCSTLVTLIYASSATAYTADSGHLNGDKQFATTSIDSSITSTAKGKGVVVDTLTTDLATVEGQAEEVAASS